MKIRGWLILGDQYSAMTLFPHMSGGIYFGPLPHTNAYEPGQWIVWEPGIGTLALAVVCIEIPL